MGEQRRYHKKEGYAEDTRMNMIMAVGGVLLFVVIVVLCVIIWNQFHPEDGSALGGTLPSKIESTDDKSTEASGDKDDGETAGEKEDSESQEKVTMTFRKVNELVTAKDVTNLRSEPSTEKDDTVVMQLKNGTSIKRTGINDDTGWSRLEYEGEVLYAATRLLTKSAGVSDSTSTEASGTDGETDGSSDGFAEQIPAEDVVTTAGGRVIAFTKCDDWVSAKIVTNLRSEPSTDLGEQSVRYELKNTEKAHRTGIDETTGWSRVEYKGEVLYALSNLIHVVEAP